MTFFIVCYILVRKETFYMEEGKINLIYGILLNIKDGVNKITDNFDVKNPDWGKLLSVLSECEAEMVYILTKAKDEHEKNTSK